MQTVSSTPKLSYSVEEAAQILGIGRDRFFKELKAGAIKSFKAGKRRLVSMSALETYIKDRETESNKAA